MIPTLLEIGPFSIRAYGLLLAVSFIAGTWWTIRAAGRRGIPSDPIVSLVGWILLSSILGARLLFVLGHPASYEDPLEFFRIWEGGLTLYGGLIAAILVSLVFLRKHRIPFLAVADATAPALALGEAITRIGCFLNGCCFGSVCASPIGVHYPPHSYAAQTLGDVPIYPAQLFLSGGMLLLFAVLWRLDRRPWTSGLLFGIYLAGQGVIRYVVDFFRYYEEIDRIQALGPWIQTKSQAIALLLALVGALLIAQRLRSRGRAQAPARAREARS